MKPTLCGSPEDQKSEDVGMLLLDVGTYMLPFVGSVRSTIEFFTGRNMITGEKLSEMEKWLGLGMALIGGAGVARGLAHAMGEAGKAAEAARGLSSVGRDLGKGLGKEGLQGAETVGKASRSLEREGQALGKAEGAVGHALQEGEHVGGRAVGEGGRLAEGERGGLLSGSSGGDSYIGGGIYPVDSQITGTPAEWETAIYNQNIEYAFALNANNRLEAFAWGMENEVRFVGISEGDKILENSLVIHNHPNGGTFSEGDLRFAAKYNVGELRAVALEGRTFSGDKIPVPYSIKPTNGWSSSEEIGNAFKILENDLPEYNRSFRNYHKLVLERLSKKFMLNYKREEFPFGFTD